MIAIKDIKTRVADVLTENGFNVVASEIQEGFSKPAVFVNVFPSSVELLTCGGMTEQVTDSVEIKYISASETMEDCVEVSERLKELFLYHTFDLKDRHLTIQRIEFEVDGTVLYAFFDVEFIQQARVDTEEFDSMTELQIGGI